MVESFNIFQHIVVFQVSGVSDRTNEKDISCDIGEVMRNYSLNHELICVLEIYVERDDLSGIKIERTIRYIHHVFLIRNQVVYRIPWFRLGITYRFK